MAYETRQKFKATNGNVYTKETDPDTGDSRYRKNGSFCSPNAFSGASDHVDQRVIVDGQSTPDRQTTVPVPGDGPNDVDFVDIDYRDASAVGKMVMEDDPLVDEYEINGESYTADQLKGAFSRAHERRADAVRYVV